MQQRNNWKTGNAPPLPQVREQLDPRHGEAEQSPRDSSLIFPFDEPVVPFCGIVRVGAAQIESEGVPGHELDAVPHHADLVQRRLPVEDHDIPVAEKALDYPTELKPYLVAILAVSQVDHDAR